MKKNIYISTGAFADRPLREVLIIFKKFNIKNIELSSGKYTHNIKKILLSYKKKNNFILHNYFPPPKNSFVINLSSENKNIYKKSFKFIKNSINLSEQIGARFFSFHAGFLININKKNLGKKLKKKKLYNKEKSIERFCKAVTKLSNYAKKKDVELLIENNVITKKNFEIFKRNPLLMCDPQETEEIMNKTPSNVNLLLDLGHLKVSAKTLGFNKIEYLNKFKKTIKALHISDNNGLTDSNSKFHNKSWFWKYINKKLKFYSIEVYNQSIKTLILQKKLLQKKLNAK